MYELPTPLGIPRFDTCCSVSQPESVLWEDVRSAKVGLDVLVDAFPVPLSCSAGCARKVTVTSRALEC